MTVVVFGHEKGGVGKSSIALNFTVLAAEAGVDVVLLDTDRQQSAVSWLELRMQNPDIKPIPILSNHVNPLQELESLSARYELVVCDIGAQSYKALIDCGKVADLYIIPIGTSDLDITPAEELLRVLRKVPRPAGDAVNAWCVINRAPSTANSQEVIRTRERLEEQGHKVMKTTLSYRSAWRNMANSGRAIHELKGKSRDDKARSEVQALFDEVVALVNADAKA